MIVWKLFRNVLLVCKAQKMTNGNVRLKGQCFVFFNLAALLVVHVF